HVPTFGAHKTWRGFAVMIAATVPGVWISAALDAPLFPESPAEQSALGAALGFAYAVAELPNSWVKRRIGIASGKRGRGAVGVLFALVDQADSALGCALVYALWLDISPLTFAVAAGLGPAVHLLGNVSLWALGFRKEPL
ncbi:MAG: CDP-archaeol synthase, partial [Bdellovibrionales bacterium]|nr:CDP-archaeol synthase [Bdellovibrionales bacterium]